MLKPLKLAIVGLALNWAIPSLWTEAASIDRALANAEQTLESAQSKLQSTRQKIAIERSELHRQLQVSASQLKRQQAEWSELSARLSRLQASEESASATVQNQQSEVAQVVQIVEDFQTDLESRIHVAELRPFRVRTLDSSGTSSGTELDLMATVAPLLKSLEGSVRRVEDLIGGTRYTSSVLTPNERVASGTVVQMGPIAYFQDDAQSLAGLVTQHPSVYEPALVPATSGEQAAIAALINKEEARIPIDPTGARFSRPANAAKGLWEHIQQGGPVMAPIIALALFASLIAIVKAGQLARLGTRIPSRFTELLTLLGEGNTKSALAVAQSTPAPLGELIEFAIQHQDKSRLLLEELLEERIYAVKAQLERALPWIAVTAASAPLLGLLGTVTGMIDTFGLIAAYGSGDPKLLSSGISEALITTKFGLGMAIPAMLIHAFLNRKVKRVIIAMEQTAWRFVNERHARQDEEA